MSPIEMAMQETLFQMYFWQIALTVLGVVVAGILLARVLYRIFRDSDRRRVTIPAVFLYGEHVYGQVEIQDKGRLASNNTQVMLEQHKLNFLDEEKNEEISFLVSYDVPHSWEDGVKGKLTYSGKRFIAFQAEYDRNWWHDKRRLLRINRLETVAFFMVSD